MRLIPALTAVLFSATAAFAGDYSKPAPQSGGQMLTHKYPAKHNFCPEGMQPVEMLGQVMCGVPNAGPYVDRAGGKRKKVKTVTHTHAKTHTHTMVVKDW